MTHHLGRHSLTHELNVSESLTVAGINILSKLDELTSELSTLEIKQNNLSVQNLSSSTFQNTLYSLGGIYLDNLSTSNTLTFIPPVIVDWTVDQTDIDIHINNIPNLSYAPNSLASNGTPGLSAYNFSGDRKNKLASISEGAQVNVQADWAAVAGDTFINNKPTSINDFNDNLMFFTNALSTSNGGNLLRVEGTNNVIYTPPTLNKTTVGLGNVTNEAKTTMFTSPTFTGNVNATGDLSVAGATVTGNVYSIGELQGKGVIIKSRTNFSGSTTATDYNDIRHFRQYTENSDNVLPAGKMIYVKTKFKSDMAENYNLPYGAILEIHDQVGDNGTRYNSGIFVNGSIGRTGVSYHLSDDRVKSYENDLVDATSTLIKLRPQKYQKHTDLFLDENNETPDLSNVQNFTEVGFIAQEVENIEELKFMVKTIDEPTGLKGLSYDNLLGYLVKSVQEIDSRIKVLETSAGGTGGRS